MRHRAVVIEKTGAARTLVLRDQPDVPPGADDVVIDVKYSGVNFADIMMRLGLYSDAPPRPFVPGYEVGGVIAEVGSNVTQVKVGDEVTAGCYFGGYSSRVTVPVGQVVPLSSKLDLKTASAIPVAFFTAHVALNEMGRIRSGDKVLIEGATGGVGTIAVQLAKQVGAEVVGLTSSPSKLGYIEDLGATAFTREAFASAPGNDRFDFVLNASGGLSVKDHLGRLGIAGRMVCIGLGAGIKDGKKNVIHLAKAFLQTPKISIFKMFDYNAGIFGLNVLHVLQDPSWVARVTSAMVAAAEQGLTAHVSHVIPAEEVARAHEVLQTKQATGKVLISW